MVSFNTRIDNKSAIAYLLAAAVGGEPRPFVTTVQIEQPRVVDAMIETTATIGHNALCDDDGDWESYLSFEAARRGVTVDAVRAEEDAAAQEIATMQIDRDKLARAAQASRDDHPFLSDDDSSPS